MNAFACAVWGAMLDGQWMTARQVTDRLPPEYEGTVRNRLDILVREGYAEKRKKGTLVVPRTEYRRTGRTPPTVIGSPRERILSAMSPGGVYTGTGLSDSCHMSYTTAMRVLSELESEGVVEQRIHNSRVYWVVKA